MKIGDYLVSKGLLTAAQLQAALAKQAADPGKKFGEICIAEGFLDAAKFEAAFKECPTEIEPFRRRLNRSDGD